MKMHEIVSFLSTAFEKFCGVKFDPNFFSFSQKLPLKSEILVSTERTSCGKLYYPSGYAQIFSHKKSKFRFFDRFSIVFQHFSKNTLPNLRF